MVEWWALDAAVGLVGQRAVGYMRTTLEHKAMPQTNDVLCSLDKDLTIHKINGQG